MKPPRKPTRRDLLIIVARLEGILGRVAMAAGDRNPERARDIDDLVEAGNQLGIDARSFEPPIRKETGPWSTRAYPTRVDRAPCAQAGCEEEADGTEYCRRHTGAEPPPAPRRCGAFACGAELSGRRPFCPRHTSRKDRPNPFPLDGDD